MTKYYYRYNLQGDVIALLNNAGTVVAEYNYTAYGKPIGTVTAIGAINPFRYRGYYFDSETGFYYLQSRYYDPNATRFINADSQFDEGVGIFQYNLFLYCGNNPVNHIDIYGTKAYWISGKKGSGYDLSPLVKTGLWENRFTEYVGFKKGKGTEYDYHIFRTKAKNKRFIWSYTTYTEVWYYISTKTKKQWDNFCSKKFGWYYEWVAEIGRITEQTAMDLICNGNQYANLGATIITCIITKMPKELKHIISYTKGRSDKTKITIPFGKKIFSYNSFYINPKKFLYSLYLW